MTIIEFEFATPRVPYRAAVVREDQATDGSRVYLAEIPDLPGCMAHGETEEEALQNVEEAAELYLEALDSGRQTRQAVAPTPTSGTGFFGARIGTKVARAEEVESHLELQRTR